VHCRVGEQQVHEALLAKARSGAITAANLRASYGRIMKLKAWM
jgi:hypothetical protein